METSNQPSLGSADITVCVEGGFIYTLDIEYRINTVRQVSNLLLDQLSLLFVLKAPDIEYRINAWRQVSNLL